VNASHPDYLIVGGGILGLSVARALLQRQAGTVTLLEKEDQPGRHASGRNSGVLHAGLYYAPESLKARFCKEGAQRMKAYAAEKKVPCLPFGKVIVAQNEADLPRMEALRQRAVANGVPIEVLTPDQLRQHEPEAHTYERALWSPSTAVTEPRLILQHLVNDLLASGRCHILFSESLQNVNPTEKKALTSKQTLSYGHLINTAGLFADRVAHGMGSGLDYQLLPFRGRYQQVRPPLMEKIRGLIYPVPDPALPFLGVHFTRSAHGDVYVGPTAEPALGREHYTGIRGMRPADSLQMGLALGRMTLSNKNGIRSHIALELEKRMPGGLWQAARALVPALQRDQLVDCSKVGIRAQLIHRRTLAFVHDFVIEKGLNSTHVLNAVSPAFTASLSFSEHIADIALGHSTGDAS